ncbi:MAG: aminopeptidase P family protein [Phycisphaerales bacterium]|nr:MAG: aminopeptidase P family protein [Phycisphaerales bacterium]
MSSTPDTAASTAILCAGIPAINNSLYHKIRFSVGDPAALIELPAGSRKTLIIRDIEMERARKHARADDVFCPADFAPKGGLSGDREIATAQATAECLCRAGVRQVVSDRSLPLIFVHEIKQAGMAIECDPEMGVLERRAKDEQEIAWLREAQQMTENVMRMACETIANAEARADGVLMHGGEPLTAERVRSMIDVFLLDHDYSNQPAIVAGGPEGGDCHNAGTGDLRTGEPVIIDIFPRNRKTLYNGDCTRTVVHGDVPDEIAKWHAIVVEAKAAAIAATCAGITGEEVHAATSAVITANGYPMGLPPDDAPDAYCGMVHGTGHGVGLEVHEPPLLDKGGPELVVGDILTIEPGLYSKAIGGVRVEDMVVVTETGCDNFNTLPEGLEWK